MEEDYPIPHEVERQRIVSVIEYSCPHCRKYLGENYKSAVEHVRIPLQKNKLPVGFIFKDGIGDRRGNLQVFRYFRIIVPEEPIPNTGHCLKSEIAEDHSVIQPSIRFVFEYVIPCSLSHKRIDETFQNEAFQRKYLKEACQLEYDYCELSNAKIMSNLDQLILNQDEFDEVILSLENPKVFWTHSGHRAFKKPEGINLRDLYPLIRTTPGIEERLKTIPTD